MSYRSNVCLWLSQEAVKKMDKKMKAAFLNAFGTPVKTRPAADGRVWHDRTMWNQVVDEDDIMGFLKSLDKTNGELYELIVVGEGEDDWQEETNKGYLEGWNLSSEVVFSFDGRPLK